MNCDAKNASSDAIRRSHASASARPPPTAAPCTVARPGSRCYRARMQIGTSIFFQNQRDATDEDVWQHELHLADLAEPLGFDSIWSVEHHFTSYTMCPDVLQLLTYLAGRTRSV